MPEALLHDLGMHALTQEHRGVGVPQVVDPAGDAGRLEDPTDGRRYTLGLLTSGAQVLPAPGVSCRGLSVGGALTIGLRKDARRLKSTIAVVDRDKCAMTRNDGACRRCDTHEPGAA